MLKYIYIVDNLFLWFSLLCVFFVCVFLTMSRFLEYGEHNGHMYGTSLDSVQDVLDNGKICVIDLEPHVGVIYDYQKHTSYVFIISLAANSDAHAHICLFQCINSVRTKKLKPYIIYVRPPSPARMKQTRKDPHFLSNRYIKRYFYVRYAFDVSCNTFVSDNRLIRCYERK